MPPKGKGRGRGRALKSVAKAADHESDSEQLEQLEQLQASEHPATQPPSSSMPQTPQIHESDNETDAASVTSKTSVLSKTIGRNKKTKIHYKDMAKKGTNSPRPLHACDTMNKFVLRS